MTRLVYVQESSRRSVRALYDLRYQLLKLTLVVLPLSLLLAWWLGRRFVAPIEELRHQVRDRLRPGVTEPRAPISLDRGDELGELASAFEHMVGQLDSRARSNEAFVADVVHELKSPVATVRACAEILEDVASTGVESGVPSDRAARLSRALSASAMRMESLLSRLLELARAESGMPDVERVPLAFDTLVEDVVAEANVRHPDARITLEGQSHGRIVGVPDALTDAVRNLIDNAAVFGTAVVASLEDVEGGIRLVVADDGPGIAPEDLPRVFERFFTTRPRAEGTGLGLALVRAVIESHGGQVEVSSAAGHGVRVTVMLPV